MASWLEEPEEHKRRSGVVTSSQSSGRASSNPVLAASRRTPQHPRRRTHHSDRGTRDRMGQNGIRLRRCVQDPRGRHRMLRRGPVRSTRSRWPQPARDSVLRVRSVTTHRWTLPSASTETDTEPSGDAAMATFSLVWPEPLRHPRSKLSTNHRSPLSRCPACRPDSKSSVRMRVSS